MKGLSKWSANGVRVLGCTLLTIPLAWLGLETQAIAGPVVLSNGGNAVMNLNLDASVAAPLGMYSWAVNGVQQVAQQWFWYRVGNSNPEKDLTSITTTPTITPFMTRQVTALYSAPQQYGVQVTYLLGGGSAGSPNNGYTETIRVYNYSTSSALDFHLFQYNALNMGGSVEFTTDAGGYGQVTQSSSLGKFIQSGTPSASLAEATLDGSTLGNLVNGVPNDLRGTVPATPGSSVAWALQWNLNVPANSSLVISLVATVPEPTTLGVLGLGLAIGLLRARRKVS